MKHMMSKMTDKTTPLQARGIDQAARRYGWVEYNMTYWRYRAEDPITGVWAWRYKAMPGTNGPKYYWTNPGGFAKAKPSQLNYYAPQGGALLRASVLHDGGRLHIVNGEPAVLAMLSAGIQNVLSWYGETSIPDTFALDMHRLGVARVTYWPDYDDTGRAAGAKVRRACEMGGIGFEALDHGVRVDKADINDLWITCQFDHHEFKRRLAAARQVVLCEIYDKPTYQRVYEASGEKERLIADLAAYIQSHAQGKVHQRGDWLNHRSLLRSDDNEPSAGFNIVTGVYKDFGGPGAVLSCWDLARELGFDLALYRPVRQSRTRLTTASPKQASQPPHAPQVLQDDLQDDQVTSKAVYITWWDRPDWRREHQMFTIGGPLHAAQVVARLRQARESGQIGGTFSAADFAAAINMAKSKAVKYLRFLEGILVCRSGRAWSLKDDADFGLLKDRYVIPALKQRVFRHTLAPLDDTLKEVIGNEEAILWHQAQAHAHLHVGQNAENAEYLKLVRILCAPVPHWAMPDPWVDWTLYHRACIRAVIDTYYAAHEARIEDSQARRRADIEARVHGASAAMIAEVLGLTISTTRRMLKQMALAGVIETYSNVAYPQFDRSEELNCKREVLRKRIADLEGKYQGRLISAVVVRGVERHVVSLAKGVSDYVLDLISDADVVTFKLRQAHAHLPGWQSIEALIGTKEIFTNDSTPDVINNASEDQSTSVPAPSVDVAASEAATRAIQRRLRRLDHAYKPQWIAQQMTIAYYSAPDDLKPIYAQVLGQAPTARACHVPF